jgi:hypothetical protein
VIFNLWPRVVVKLGEERHVFDRSKLMFTDVQEIERVTKLSFGEWQGELGRYSITAVAALIHVLRRRDGMPSDFATMNFAADDLDVIPLHADDSEYTPEEATAELTKRMQESTAANGAGPTPAANGQASPSGEASSTTRPTTTSPSSPPSSASGPGNGTSSRTRTGSGARRTSTRS